MFKFLVLASMLFLAVESASSSVKNLKQFIPWDKIEAEDYNVASGAYSLVLCGSVYGLGYTEAGHYAAYFDVDFEDGAELVTFRLSGSRPDLEMGYIYLRLGSSSTEPVASIVVSSTGGSSACKYILITSFLPALISGMQDLYLTFESANGDGIVNIDWFQFTKRYV